tara:strand:- start:3366 stop:3596 length:231 start_codon:yes stop_codon:yes gene_type:complete
MAFFIMEYRVKDYGFRHAFSRDPKAGRKVFTVSGDDIGTHDIATVEAMARLPESTPEGYELHSIIDRDAAKEQPHE